MIEHEVDFEPEDVVEEIEVEAPTNIFEGMDPVFLKTLQNAIDAMGLGSEDGANRLKKLSPDSKEFTDLICELERDTGLSYDDAKAKLIEWQSLQENLEAMIQQEKQKTKTLGARPIWRCGVCGRADKPWIACYVAPFIVRYEKVPMGGD
jgi:rubrerythrin